MYIRISSRALGTIWLSSYQLFYEISPHMALFTIFALSLCRPPLLHLLCLLCCVFFGHTTGTSAQLTIPLPVIYIREQAHGGFSTPANGVAVMIWVYLVEGELGGVGDCCWMEAGECWGGLPWESLTMVACTSQQRDNFSASKNRSAEVSVCFSHSPLTSTFEQKKSKKSSVDNYYFMLMLAKSITNNNKKYLNIRAW